MCKSALFDKVTEPTTCSSLPAAASVKPFAFERFTSTHSISLAVANVCATLPLKVKLAADASIVPLLVKFPPTVKVVSSKSNMLVASTLTAPVAVILFNVVTVFPFAIDNALNEPPTLVMVWSFVPLKVVVFVPGVYVPVISQFPFTETFFEFALKVPALVKSFSVSA